MNIGYFMHPHRLIVDISTLLNAGQPHITHTTVFPNIFVRLSLLLFCLLLLLYALAPADTGASCFSAGHVCTSVLLEIANTNTMYSFQTSLQTMMRQQYLSLLPACQRQGAQPLNILQSSDGSVARLINAFTWPSIREYIWHFASSKYLQPQSLFLRHCDRLHQRLDSSSRSTSS